MKKWSVRIMLPSGRTTRTIIRADSGIAADEMAILLYGSGKVLTKAIEVDE